MTDAVLLTGATGFVGMSVLARLAEREDGPDVVCVVRARDRADAADRLEHVARTLWETPPAGLSRVRAIRGELTEPGLGLDSSDAAALRGAGSTTVLHCAASVSFTLPLDEARATNLDGARHVLGVAADLPGLERVVHVSTAYVGGRHEGTFTEADRDLGQAPRNTYEQTKLEAEELVAASGLPWLIARPSIVVGESTSGWTSSFNVLYAPLRAYARGLIKAGGPPIPADPRGLLDIVPIDHVADGLVALVDGAGQPQDTVHLVAGPDAIRVSELIDLAARAFGRAPAALGSGPDASDSDLTETYLPYFDVRVQFANARSRALLAAAGVASPPPLEDYFPQLIAFAEQARWGKVSRPRSVAGRVTAG